MSDELAQDEAQESNPPVDTGDDSGELENAPVEELEDSGEHSGNEIADLDSILDISVALSVEIGQTDLNLLKKKMK